MQRSIRRLAPPLVLAYLIAIAAFMYFVVLGYPLHCSQVVSMGPNVEGVVWFGPR